MRKRFDVLLITTFLLFVCTTSATGTASAATASEDILLQLEQEAPEQLDTSVCLERVDPGPCESFVHKWYFDSESQTCRTFIYGGCEGNGNRFDIEAECLHRCVGSDHTLPPYLNDRTSTSRSDDSLSASSVGTTSPSPPRWRLPTVPTPPPVPLEERGEELTFEETGHQKVFMFAQANTFIQLDNNKIPTFQLRLCRRIHFEFRTRLPHGLLVYHSVKGRPDGLEPYALYITVQNGQLKVVHVFGKYSTSLTVGQGLNRDQWHSVSVLIDVHRARLKASVDKLEEKEIHIQGVHNSYGVHADLQSVVLIGGLNPEERLHGVKYIIESFVGCIRNISLSAGKGASDLLPIRPLIASQHENVVEGCNNLCRTPKALCFFGSKCINHYHSYTCDCFGMKYEGEFCDTYTATVLTMRGSSYVSYRVYDWKDRVHSISNRVSMFFKTRFDDSALFYASGEQDHYAAASLINGTVQIELNLGEGAIKTSLGEDLTDNHWHNLTIFHIGDQVTLVLDNEAKLLDLPGSAQYWYIDPEIYIGGGPDLGKKDALQSKNNFAGNLKYVYYNDVNILYELKHGNQKVHYIGVLEAEFKDDDVEVIPITFPFPKSHIWWPNNQPDLLDVNFDFKISNRTMMAVLLSSDVTTSQGHGFWELRIVNGEIRFELYPDHAKNVTHLTTIKFDSRIGWHTVDLQYNNGELRLTVDYKNKMAQLFGLQFKLGDKFLIGSGDKTNSGLVGCIRDIRINGLPLEPRYVVRSKYSVGDVSLDDCRLVDPCQRPDACEHGGKCRVDEDRLRCDCQGTGYIGNNCHFAYFKKTCEELALLGYTKPDVYLIDIDGNGRFPPAHVKCEFQSLEDSTKTIVEHNLPSQVDVRSTSETDFRFSIKYREFTAEMLQELISHSLHCSQYIKYDCYKAPLELHSATWFTSSAGKDIVDYIGNVKKGACPCAVNKTCISAEHTCNCDISEGKWHSDEGYFNTPGSLGITEMVFLQQRELDNDAQGRITLGPLECLETNTQRYVVTFTSSQSFIEVPGWRKGDISFSFRTTGEKAILLYQPPIRKGYPSFMLALISDYELMFNFTLNTGRARELIVRSDRRLNNGEWQKLWIDYNEHHVRFTINTEYRMDNLLPDEQFGPFEGSMFIGGAPEDHLEGTMVRQGLIGCFRGLVVNGIILDIYSYMSVHLSEIIKDCKPACNPNPCRNGAVCRELWSTYECVCENPWAHLGVNCENNINSKALTFMTRESYLKKNYLAIVSVEEKDLMKHIMRENILVNLRTFDNHSLVLYANDNVNNFVQIHLDEGRFVVFMFNYGNQIRNITVEDPELNSGKSVQIAIERSEKETVLHVNTIMKSLPIGVRLLTWYSNKPWINPDQEVLAPMRPPAPPTEYFQINLGGYDRMNLISKNNQQPPLEGYVGCIRGLKIGNHLFDLSSQIENTLKKAFAEFVDMAERDTLIWIGYRQIKGKFNAFQRERAGVVSGCRMRCDERPCKNEGVCYEDFQKGESSCNCEHTSYFGEFCDQEKGADFGGESILQRKFTLEGQVDEVKVQLAFSTSDFSQSKSILLLVQSDNSRSYFLLVALTTEGHLMFEEDREGDRGTIGSRVKDRNFLDGSRHSIYYRRTNDTATLLVDRAEVVLVPLPREPISEQSGARSGTNEVQIGGIITNDPRFASYRGYSGCLSNVFVEVNGESMKPLEEYMLFTKTGSDTVHVQNAPGVRSAQCAPFELNPRQRHFESSLNMSLGHDKGWVEDPPAKIPYTSLYMETSTEEDQSTRVIFLTLVSLFVIVILGGFYEVFRTHLKYKRRRDEEMAAAILWPKGQPPILKPTASIKPSLGYKPVPQHEKGSRAVSLTGSNPSLDKKSSLPRNEHRPSIGGNSLLPHLGVPEHKQNGSVTFSEHTPNKSQQDLVNLDKSLEELSRALHESLQGDCDDSELDQGDHDRDEATALQSERDLKPAGFAHRGYTNPEYLHSIHEDNLDKRAALADDDGGGGAKGPSRTHGGVPRAILPAIFLSENARTFNNPISYLGGPRLDSSGTRASKESVLSLD